MQDIYSDRSYGEDEVGFGERLGILVVDFQKAFTDGRFPMGGSDRIDKAVENTARLLSVAREKNIPVASCFVAYPNLASMPYWKVGAIKETLFEGSEAAELDPRIADHEYDYVFQKEGASAFFMTPCSAFFTKHKVDTIAVTGCVTSGCVRASAVDSFQFGFRTMLVDDCSGDHDEGPHQDTMRDVGRRYADIVHSDDVINFMMRNN